MANTKPGFVFVFCEYMEDPINLNLPSTFGFILPQKKTVLILLMLRPSAAEIEEKKLYQIANCPASITEVGLRTQTKFFGQNILYELAILGI